MIIRLWWLPQWLVTYGCHVSVTIYLHVVPSLGRHTLLHSTGAKCFSSKENVLQGIASQQIQLFFAFVVHWSAKFQWRAQVIFVESESRALRVRVESDSSEILSSRVMNWSSQVRVESQELSSDFDSLAYKLDSRSSHTNFKLFHIYFWL